jgi:hypothetical protein
VLKLITLPPSCVDCHEIREPQFPRTLGVCTGIALLLSLPPLMDNVTPDLRFWTSRVRPNNRMCVCVCVCERESARTQHTHTHTHTRLRSQHSDSLLAGRTGIRIPVEAKFNAPVQTGSGANPASCSVRNESIPSPGVKKSRYDVSYRSKSSAQFNLLVTRCINKFNIQQLYALPTPYLCVV